MMRLPDRISNLYYTEHETEFNNFRLYMKTGAPEYINFDTTMLPYLMMALQKLL